MIKIILLISGLTVLSAGAGDLNLQNPVEAFAFKISHLELSIDADGVAAKICKDSKSGLKIELQSEKIIKVRF